MAQNDQMQLSSSHLIEPASEAELREISEKLRLCISDKHLPEYLKWLNGTLDSLKALRDIPETVIPVTYPRVPGIIPERGDNPYNAWARKVTIQGNGTGTLVGKRIAIKDNIFMAGVPLENGSKVWSGYVPEFDATVVTRILNAGGTIVGTATCENQCMGLGGIHSVSGPVLNPNDTTRHAGGSSSGSAALVASGLVNMALGGDQGGSIRVPASWCGCVGLKPTWGLVPVTGSIGLEPTMDAIGPLAASVFDVALLLEVIAGHDEERDHRQSSHAMDPPQYSKLLKGNLAGVKLGYVTEGFENCSPGVKSVIDKMVKRLRTEGAVIDNISLPEVYTAKHIYTAISVEYSNYQTSGFAEFYQRTANIHIRKTLKTNSHNMQTKAKALRILKEYIDLKDGVELQAMARNRIPTIKKAVNAAFKNFDALIMPSAKYVAKKLQASNTTVTDNVRLANVCGIPALSLNVGSCLPEPCDGQEGSTELPVGLQILVEKFEEAKLLDIAYGIESLMNGHPLR